MNLTEVAIEDGALRLFWDDHVATLSGAKLRESCRCAECSARARQGLAVTAAEQTAVIDIVPIGAYAAQLRFSDGHERGIFPWTYLEELARRAA